MRIIFHEIKTPPNDLPTLRNFTATESTYRFSSYAINFSANYANYVTRSAFPSQTNTYPRTVVFVEIVTPCVISINRDQGNLYDYIYVLTVLNRRYFCLLSYVEKCQMTRLSIETLARICPIFLAFSI